LSIVDAWSVIALVGRRKGMRQYLMPASEVRRRQLILRPDLGKADGSYAEGGIDSWRWRLRRRPKCRGMMLDDGNS